MLLALTAAIALFAPAQGTTEFFIIRAENMSPRLEINQRVEFDLAAYAEQAPEVDDIVLIHPPVGARRTRCASPRTPRTDQLCVKPHGGADRSVRFVMRVVAVGGD